MVEVSIDLWFVITILAAGLAIFDAISRLRGHRANSLLAILELVFGGLLLLTLFVSLPFPTFWIPLALLITLLVIIFLPHKGSGGRRTITIIAAVLTAVLVLVRAGWLNIPGLG